MKIQLFLKLQSLKMTAQEERAYRSYFWEQSSLGVYIWTQPSYQVSVYIWTQLTEDPAVGVYIWTQPNCSIIIHQLPRT